MAAMAQMTHCTGVRGSAVVAAGSWAIFGRPSEFSDFQVVWHSRAEDFILMEQSAVVTKKREGKRSKMWIVFVIGAVLSWGVYGAALHKGQGLLGNPLKALLCVGVAYFLIGVLAPVVALSGQGGVTGFNLGGTLWAGLGGALGAVGAVCIIYAFKNGGLPNYVMPLVFGGAPVINVLLSMAMHPPKAAPNPMLYLGFVLD